MGNSSDTIEISKTTGMTISIGILIALITFVFSAGSWVSSVNAQMGNNKRDLESLGPRIEKLNDNLTATNENVIKLQVQAERLLERER